MMKLLGACNFDKYKPRHFIIAENDGMSIEKAKCSEKSSTIHLIKRSRKVGQNYFLSIFTTILAIIHSIPLVYKIKPELLLVNGPGTCLPICVITLILNVRLDWQNLFNLPPICIIEYIWTILFWRHFFILIWSSKKIFSYLFFKVAENHTKMQNCICRKYLPREKFFADWKTPVLLEYSR